MYYYLHNRYLVYTFVTAVNFTTITFNTGLKFPIYFCAFGSGISREIEHWLR